MKPTLRSNELDSYELAISNRATNVLKSEGISTVEELLTWNSDGLLKLPSLGRVALNEIIEKLAEHGLQLSSEIDATCVSYYGKGGRTQEILIMSNVNYDPKLSQTKGKP